MEKEEIKRRMRVMLICVGILFGSVFIYKSIKSLALQFFMSHNSHVVTVSTMKVKNESWESTLLASGSLRAVKGVNVTTELAGIVKNIYFTPGTIVSENTLLVQLRNQSDLAQLRSIEANATLAKITYYRDKAQYAARAISKATLDADEANLKSLNAQVEQQAAIVAKKAIRAPFTGRLGINLVNLGQYINNGDAIVMLQSQDPLYVDFYVPQQSLPKLMMGQRVMVTSDSFPNTIFQGKITTINPAVDVSTRNVEVEATLPNPKYELTPGMFVSVEVIIDKPQRYLTIPETAVSFNPYGEIVYRITKKKKTKNVIANQIFVKTGETRGDQVTVLQGLKEGDEVVTSGQLKLKNGSQVAINNSIMPSDSAMPEVGNEH